MLKNNIHLLINKHNKMVLEKQCQKQNLDMSKATSPLKMNSTISIIKLMTLSCLEARVQKVKDSWKLEMP